MYKIGKTGDQILIDKTHIQCKYFYWKLSKFVVNDQNDKWKRWRTRMYKIDITGDQILIDKTHIRCKYFYLG